VVSKKFKDEMSLDSDKFGDKKDNGKPVPASLNEFTTPIMLPTVFQIPQTSHQPFIVE
jgi:hypothetical protein